MATVGSDDRQARPPTRNMSLNSAPSGVKCVERNVSRARLENRNQRRKSVAAENSSRVARLQRAAHSRLGNGPSPSPMYRQRQSARRLTSKSVSEGTRISAGSANDCCKYVGHPNADDGKGEDTRIRRRLRERAIPAAQQHEQGRTEDEHDQAHRNCGHKPDNECVGAKCIGARFFSPAKRSRDRG